MQLLLQGRPVSLQTGLLVPSPLTGILSFSKLPLQSPNLLQQASLAGLRCLQSLMPLQGRRGFAFRAGNQGLLSVTTRTPLTLLDDHAGH